MSQKINIFTMLTVINTIITKYVIFVETQLLTLWWTIRAHSSQDQIRQIRLHVQI